VTDEAWVLDVDQHRGFLEAVTGERLPADPEADDCYRAGNRLEGFIEENGHRQWPPTPDAADKSVDGWDELHWLARFFRAYNEQDSGPDPAPLQ
jgi:hypothetical protein